MTNGDGLETKTRSVAPVSEPDENGRPAGTGRQGRTKKIFLPVLIVALLGGAVAAYFLVLSRDSGESGSAGISDPETSTATAELRDLVETESLDGTLTYASESTVAAQSQRASGAQGASAQSGTITELAPEGEIVVVGEALYWVDGNPVVLMDGEALAWRTLARGIEARPIVNQLPGTITAITSEGATRQPGQILYRVDTRPVVLMNGQVPAWRTLQSGVENSWDVRQLEENLVALGYDPDGEVVVNTVFNSATEAAIERWQEDLGVEVDGIVDLGEVVFLPGEQRIGGQLASVGASAQPGLPITQVSSAEQVVTLELAANRQDLVAVGDAVVVELPDGSEVEGTVATIGTAAQVAPSQVGTDGAGEAFVEVTITLTDTTTVQLDQSPVDIVVTTESAECVLTVPVTALIALAGGGYAVEVVDGETTTLVAVDPGLFADGFVEVESNGLFDGDTVVVPA